MIKIKEDNRNRKFIIPDDIEMKQSDYMTDDYLDEDEIENETRFVKALGSSLNELYIVTSDSYTGDLETFEKVFDSLYYSDNVNEVEGTDYKISTRNGHRYGVRLMNDYMCIIATKKAFSAL